MEKEIQIFNYNNNFVRTIEKDGQVWFVAKDVCDVLELSNTTVAIEALDEDERSKFFLGRQGEANIISESGLYSLIMRSNKPEAKNFARWVRKDVLPQIIHTGSYNVQKETPKLPTVLEGAKLIFETAGIKGNQLALALDKTAKHYTGESLLALGGVQLEVETKRQALTPSEIGLELGISGRRVNEILAGAGFQHKIADKWEPLEPGMPYAVMIDTGKQHSDGTPIRQLKWNSSIIEEMRITA